MQLPQKLHPLTPQPDWSGKRLKQIVLEAFPGVSSRSALLIIRNGLVKDSEGNVLDDADLHAPAGRTLTVDLRHGIHGQGTASRTPLRDRLLVVHDDPHLAVVSKPPFTPVQPIDEEFKSSRVEAAPVVELLKHLWRQQGAAVVNPILVQRLDLETSGLLVVAKTDEAARLLQQQLLPPRRLTRQYVAIVAGETLAEKGTWESSLGVGVDGRRCSLRGKAAADGQQALTRFRIRERLRGALLLDLQLETGRTHQIRIHCAEAGHPVAGDKLYATLPPTDGTPLSWPKRRKKSDPAPLGAPRIMLHAALLSFEHPATGERMTFKKDPPEDFAEFLKSLQLEK
jgi:23S rRNA pseudouridine1911/1915/1917 synthase